jgi:hypothetical protein
LTRRLGQLVDALAAAPTESIPGACGNWAATKAAYRFLDSERVTAEAIHKGAQAAVLERIAEMPMVLVLQDTTELNLTHHPETEGLGSLDGTYQRGLKVHTSLAVSVEGVPQGVVAQHVWARDPEEHGKAQARRKRFTHEKESQRWLDAVQHSEQVIPATIRMITVADREADIYDLFAQPRRPGSELLIRATHNRRVTHAEAEYVWAAARSVEETGRLTIEVGRRPGQDPRTASVALRYTRVAIHPPRHAKERSKLQPITVWAVLAEECDPPDDIADPICWLLLTTLPVTSFADAAQMVRWYATRWLIERYHFTLKSGCGLEELQLRTAERLHRALAVLGLVAWRLMWLLYEARRHPEQPCTVALERHEWQALWVRIHKTDQMPTTPPTLGEAVLWIAKLGGFLARKRDGQPGLKTLWRGWRHLHDSAVIWRLTHPDPPLPAASGCG